MGATDEVNPRETALVIVDMQNDFCAPDGIFGRSGVDVSPARRVLPGVRGLLAAAREAVMPVIFVASEYSSPDNRYLSETFLAQARRRWNGRYVTLPVCQRGTWGIDFFEDIRPGPGEIVVWKHRFDAFVETDLDLILRSRQIRTLVVAGVTTEVCVESTVRHAFFHDYACVVPRDAVAAYDEEMHDRSLRLMDRFFARVVDSAEVLEAWGVAPARAVGDRG